MVALSALISVGGIWYALRISHSKDDAGRGGALAVIVSFFAVFVRRSYGARIYQTLFRPGNPMFARLNAYKNRQPVEPFTNAELTDFFIRIVSRTNIEAAEQRLQNWALFWTGLIATVIWGFGDKIYCWLSSCPPPR